MESKFLVLSDYYFLFTCTPIHMVMSVCTSSVYILHRVAMVSLTVQLHAIDIYYMLLGFFDEIIG